MANVLVIAAHRDDEVLGAGGLIASTEDVSILYLGHWHRRGNPRSMGDVEELREAHRQVECVEAVLGAKEGRHIDGFVDNQFDTAPLADVVLEVEAHLVAVRPHTIYTHQPHDLNIDHRLTCQAVLTATRPTPGQTVKAVYGFEVPSSTEWAFGSEGFKPNVFVDITHTMDKKLEALRCYQSELRDYPHPRSERAIKARAEYWGSVAGVEYAEAFVLLREIR